MSLLSWAQMQHSTLIEAMQHAVVATDLEGRVTYWNAFAEHLYGWSSSEAVGRAVDELLRPQTFTAADDLIRTAMHRGKSWSGEYTVTRRDGTQLATFVTVSPLFDAAHTRLVGVVGVTEDATERRKSLADRERLTAIVSSSDDALVVWDFDGRITSWNAGAERIYGYSAQEMLGTRRHRLVPPERGHEVRQMVERVTRGERIDHLETQRLRKDGCTMTCR